MFERLKSSNLAKALCGDHTQLIWHYSTVLLRSDLEVQQTCLASENIVLDKLENQGVRPTWC